MGLGIGLDAGAQLFQTVMGITQLLKGNKGLKNLERPIYQQDPNIKYNQRLAGQIASQGIPDSAKNFYGDAIDRNLGSSISAGLNSGQGLNFIQSAQNNSNDAFQQLLAADAMQKQKNQGVLMDANKDLANENLRAFDYNKNIPYQEAFQKYTQQTNSGASNIFGGVKGLASDVEVTGNQLMSALSGGTLGGGSSGFGGGGSGGSFGKIAGSSDSMGGSGNINPELLKQIMQLLQQNSNYGGYEGSYNFNNFG